ncbi:MAG: ParB N-terminal domain-containing protein [Calditrichaeota bacterium]|nr:ParB N-terminal domain-containing protein [Calditrichota bacterium]
MDPRLVEVERHTILPDTHWRYRIPLPENSTLRRSVQQHGILSPLLLLEKDKKQYFIIDGFQRFEWIQGTRFTRIPARIYPAGQAELAFWKGLQINTSIRPLSVVEKAHVVQHIQGFRDEAIIQAILKDLAIPPKGTFLQIYREIAALPIPMQQYFHQYQFSFRQIERLRALKIETLEPWIRLAIQLRLKAQEFLNIMEMVWDIAVRENLSVAQCYQALSIDELLSREWTPQQKTTFLKNLLHQRRYPLLTRMRNRIDEAAKEIQENAPLPVKIFWDPNLETPGYHLQFYLEKEDDLHRLGELIEEPEFKNRLVQLFSVIRSMEED